MLLLWRRCNISIFWGLFPHGFQEVVFGTHDGRERRARKSQQCPEKFSPFLMSWIYFTLRLMTWHETSYRIHGHKEHISTVLPISAVLKGCLFTIFITVDVPTNDIFVFIYANILFLEYVYDTESLVHVCPQERSKRSKEKKGDCVDDDRPLRFYFGFLSAALPAFFAKKPLSPQSLLKECTYNVCSKLYGIFTSV